MDHVGSYSESLKIKSCFSTHTHTHKYVLLLPSSVLGSFILFFIFTTMTCRFPFLSLSLSLSFSFFFSIVSVSLIGELSRLTRSRRTIYTHLYLLFLFSRKKTTKWPQGKRRRWRLLGLLFGWAAAWKKKKGSINYKEGKVKVKAVTWLVCVARGFSFFFLSLFVTKVSATLADKSPPPPKGWGQRIRFEVGISLSLLSCVCVEKERERERENEIWLW